MDTKSFKNLDRHMYEPLSIEELEAIEGGNLVEDLFFVIGYTSRKIFEWGKREAKKENPFMASPIGSSSSGACGCG